MFPLMAMLQLNIVFREFGARADKMITGYTQKEEVWSSQDI